MIYAVAACISIGLLILNWGLYRRNIELFVCILLAVSFDFFYILPGFEYNLILLPMLGIVLFIEFLRGKLSLGRYGWWVIGYLGITLFGIMVGFFSGQSIASGIKAAKYTPLVMIYFLLAGREVDYSKFARYFIRMSVAVAVLDIVYMYTHLNVFHGMPEYMLDQLSESGRSRVVIGQFVIAASTVMAFALYQKRKGLIYLPVSAALFASLCFVQQTRGFIVGTFLGLLFVMVLSRGLTAARAAAFLVVGGILAFAFITVDLNDLSLHQVGFIKRSQSDFSKKNGRFGNSLQARLNGYEYYGNELLKHPLTGRGLLNLNWSGNSEKKLQKYRGIWLADIGIMAFLVQSGLAGALWLVYGLFKIWKDVFRYRTQMVITSYFILGTITMPDLDMFFRSSPPELSLFLFAVFLGIASNAIEQELHAVRDQSEGQFDTQWPHYDESTLNYA
jgi:hypothetical protein